MALLALPPKPPSFAQRLADGPQPFGGPGKDVQLRGQNFLKEFSAKRIPTSYSTAEHVLATKTTTEDPTLEELDDLQVYESPLLPTHTRRVRRMVVELAPPSYPDPFDEDGFPLP